MNAVIEKASADLLVRVVMILLGFGGTFLAKYLKSDNVQVNLLFWGSICLILVGVLLLIRYYYYIVVLSKNRFPFIISSTDIAMNIIDRSHFEVIYDLTLQANQTIDNYEVRFMWTGSQSTVTPLDGICEMHDHTQHKCQAGESVFIFDIPQLTSGKTTQIRYKVSLEDEEMSSLPMMTYRVNVPIKKLSMVLTRPKDVRLNEIYWKVNMGTKYEVERIFLDSDNCSFTQPSKNNVSHPKLLGSYGFYWKWE